MVEELRKWLKADPENVIVGDDGYEKDLTYYYEKYEIQNIWVAYAEGETVVDSVAVELPADRHKLVEFLLEGMHSGVETHYVKEKNLLQMHFD